MKSEGSIYPEIRGVKLGEIRGVKLRENQHYERTEEYFPIIRYKSAPGEKLKVKFTSYEIGSDPYSSNGLYQV
ncbi:MAG: hypothetical protein M3R00_08280, partial [Pseudomonadota bacterium]|nr:hypothetical protein [Pseudomonadota bacterium]